MSLLHSSNNPSQNHHCTNKNNDPSDNHQFNHHYVSRNHAKRKENENGRLSRKHHNFFYENQKKLKLSLEKKWQCACKI